MLDEIVELKVLLFVAYRFLTHLTFWEYPPHSAFCLFICYRVCMNPDLIPAFVAFLMFTALMATNLYKQRNHSHWRRPRLFHHCLAILFLDRDDYFTQEHISPGDNIAAQEAADKDWEMEQEEFWIMMTQGEDRAMYSRMRPPSNSPCSSLTLRSPTALENYNRAGEEHEKLLESIGAHDDDDDVDGEGITKNRFGVLDPVGLVLAPVQSALVPCFVILRAVKNVALVGDTNMWFIATFTFGVLSFALALVPWGLLLRLVSKLLVVLLFGPQNAYLKKEINEWCAEFFLYSNDPDRKLSDEAMQKKLRAVLDVRIEQEREARARDFKILYHGNRIIRHWKFNVERFNDPPTLHGSGTSDIRARLHRQAGTLHLMDV